MKKYLLVFAVFTVLFSACKKSDSNTTTTVDPAVQAKIDDDKIQAYLKANPSITAIKDPSGLYYQILNPGTGVNPTTKSTITVAYTGKYLDGTVFQTLPNFTSVLGAGLIQGWQIGIPFIKTGGRILLLIPSALGYGPAGKDAIPPNTVIIFTIDLFAVQG